MVGWLDWLYSNLSGIIQGIYLPIDKGRTKALSLSFFSFLFFLVFTPLLLTYLRSFKPPVAGLLIYFVKQPPWPPVGRRAVEIVERFSGRAELSKRIDVWGWICTVWASKKEGVGWWVCLIFMFCFKCVEVSYSPPPPTRRRGGASYFCLFLYLSVCLSIYLFIVL